MKKEALILDFDGVIAITEHIQIEYINKKYGLTSKREDYDRNTSLEENVNRLAGLNLSFESFYYDFTENYTMSCKLHEKAILLPFSQAVIKELARKNTLFISTARNSLGRDVIKYVLRRHEILQHFTGFHFVYAFDDKMEFVKKPKTEFISSFSGKVSFFIDDSHREIEKAKNIVPAILLDTVNDRIIKGAWTANSWLEIGDLVL